MESNIQHSVKLTHTTKQNKITLISDPKSNRTHELGMA